MDDLLAISKLNDFIFCPASIYFHGLYEGVDVMSYTGKAQMYGLKQHERIDDNNYMYAKALSAINVCSLEYGLVGKIDKYFTEECRLVESKAKIKTVYDGYVFQLYAQYFCLAEMGFEVKSLALYSISDNKSFEVELPENNPKMMQKFLKLIASIRNFKLEDFSCSNKEKCTNCIYANMCFWGDNLC